MYLQSEKLWCEKFARNLSQGKMSSQKLSPMTWRRVFNYACIIEYFRSSENKSATEGNFIDAAKIKNYSGNSTICSRNFLFTDKKLEKKERQKYKWNMLLHIRPLARHFSQYTRFTNMNKWKPEVPQSKSSQFLTPKKSFKACIKDGILISKKAPKSQPVFTITEAPSSTLNANPTLRQQIFLKKISRKKTWNFHFFFLTKWLSCYSVIKTYN